MRTGKKGKPLAKRATKPPRDADALAEITSLTVKLIKRELEHYANSNTERAPAALLSAAMGLLKVSGTDAELKREADRPESLYDEAGNPVATMVDGRPFVPRVSPSTEDVTPAAVDDFAGIDPEDFENIAKRARYLASTLDESNPERDRLLLVAREAESKL